MQPIVPCLWFDGNAEEAVNFYTSVFENSKIGHIARYTEAGFEFHGQPAGSVMIIEFELNGQDYTALNGGPHFKFNEAVSFQVMCDSQEEVDYYWEKLGEGGDPNAQQCGWLKDKFGLSWQVVPTALIEMLRDRDTKKAGNVMQAVFPMKKLEIGPLRKAYDQA
jgi:predicted 3-demethylubiquinone-9 3-methyltransferase (glyoxalase superfamily)